MKSLGVKRMWFVMVSDVEILVDDKGTAIDQPMGEPEVLGCTYSAETAERALGCLVSDKKDSVVRSTVEALPSAIQDLVNPSESTMVDDLLAKVDIKK